MDTIDGLIKKYLVNKRAGAKLRRSTNCPSEAKLTAYLEKSLSGEESEKTAQHLSQCPFCLELVEQTTRQDMSLREPGPSKQTVNQAIGLAKQRTALNFYPIRKHLWLIGTMLSFGLSFIFSKYFLQFLILALILGIKWAVSTAANSKTLIMIYDFWHRHHTHHPGENQKKHTKRFSD